MAGKILKQLGPVRKRLDDRMKDASLALNDGDIHQLRSVRNKLASNVIFYENLTTQLIDFVPEADDEQDKVDAELDRCINLNIDVKETLQELDSWVLPIIRKHFQSPNCYHIQRWKRR